MMGRDDRSKDRMKGRAKRRNTRNEREISQAQGKTDRQGCDASWKMVGRAGGAMGQEKGMAEIRPCARHRNGTKEGSPSSFRKAYVFPSTSETALNTRLEQDNDPIIGVPFSSTFESRGKRVWNSCTRSGVKEFWGSSGSSMSID